MFEEEHKNRHDLGREALVKRIWAWKDEYEARILGQLAQLGFSLDWQRTRFTLDAQCARAVRYTFFSLFNERLIYRGKRLVNWDTHLQTAVSDDEVFHEAVAGHFWHLRYPLIDPRPGEPQFVSVATTRPETMLGDTAVAVHPDPQAALATAERELEEKLAAAGDKDRPALAAQLEELAERRRTLLPTLVKLRDMALAGRKVRLPLLNREIPLVADVWARPEMGSGSVKITPAHDPNDYDVARRQNLPMLNILNPDGTLNANAGPYQGLKIMPARERVVADLDALGLVEKVEDREIELAHSDRSKTPIEPYLADQWFVRMERLSQLAMDAVTDGRIRIVPSRFARSYLDWLSEKRDWPVSRQLWWGHRIPIWYAPTASEDDLRRAFAGRDDVAWQRDPEHDQWLVCAQDHDLSEDAVPGHKLVQDPDVLDTWFSSALWPHSTFGWPDDTPELRYYYPTSVLVTNRDILTLWVARMVITGLHNMGEVPFREVYIHPTILDARRRADVEVEGQRRRPDRRDRKSRRRFAPLQPRLPDHRDAGCPHAGRVRVPALRRVDRADQEEPRPAAHRLQEVRQAVCHPVGLEAGRPGPAPGRGGQRALRAGPQFLQQAVERRPLCPAEPRRLPAGAGRRRRAGRRRPLDFEPPGHRHAPDDRGAGSFPLCRRHPRALRLCLERVLQFLRRDGQVSPAIRRPRGRWRSACWPTRSTCSCGCYTRWCRS